MLAYADRPITEWMALYVLLIIIIIIKKELI